MCGEKAGTVENNGEFILTHVNFEVDIDVVSAFMVYSAFEIAIISFCT